ncbi:polysaccharide pyruvyl transferase family protein [Devriesea agamarum]|uniref:polysaccharide pyruvyl transferase family protein n=1 Tax=Devriesea agamarum TaxID=472569 RepID=UPI00071D14A8|nr:polysaccharide pyruvyl transferase family protein [Devriesea agamarum]
MPHPPLIAVVVRTKDRRVFLRRALANIAEQTLQPLVVVVNDGGEPAAVNQEVDRLTGAFRDRVRVIHHQQPHGMEAASNAAIRAADAWASELGERVDAVAIHDDDDLWEPEFLTRTAAHLREHPEHAAVAVRTVLLHEHAEGDLLIEDRREWFHPELRHLTIQEFLRYNRVVPISLLVRRRVYDQIGLYDERLPVVGDWEFNLRLWARFDVGFLADEPLALWSRRPATGSAADNSDAEPSHHHGWDAWVRQSHIRSGLDAGQTGLFLYLAHLHELTSIQLRDQQRILDQLVQERHDTGDDGRASRGNGTGGGRRAGLCSRGKESGGGTEYQDAGVVTRPGSAGPDSTGPDSGASNGRGSSDADSATHTPDVLLDTDQAPRQDGRIDLPTRPLPRWITPRPGTGRVLVLGDIGQERYHAGDEAMAHAAVDELTARQLTPVLLTRDVEHTRRHFGPQIEAVPTFTFPPAPAEREMLLDNVVEHVHSRRELAPEHREPVARLIQQIQGCDAVLIAGGGNMNSRYGWLLMERIAVIAVAVACQRPVIVSGQTFGPTLTDTDRDLMLRALATADLVSARERFSSDLLTSAGIDCFAGLDDATFLESGPFSDIVDLEQLPVPVPDSFLAVTVTPGVHIEAFTQLLERIYSITGLEAVLLPHMAIPGTNDGDLGINRMIAAHAASPVTLLPILPARTVASVTRRAHMVLTSRYHPAIFALPAGVPTLGLIPDDYTDVRLRGALDAWGMGQWCTWADAQGMELAAEAAQELWTRRDEVGKHLAQRRATYRAGHDQWWDRVSAAAHGEHIATTTPASDLPTDAPSLNPTGDWARLTEAVRITALALSREADHARADTDRALSWDHQRSLQLAEAEHAAQRARQDLEALVTSRTYRGANRVRRTYAKARDTYSRAKNMYRGLRPGR